MKQNKRELLIFCPFLLAIMAAHFRILILIPVIIVLIFILVAVLPFAHGHENLWLFLISIFSFAPLNLYLLSEYTGWQDFLHISSDVEYFYYISSMIVAFVALTGVEEVITGFLGRLIWRRQYKLGIPESEE